MSFKSWFSHGMPSRSTYSAQQLREASDSSSVDFSSASFAKHSVHVLVVPPGTDVVLAIFQHVVRSGVQACFVSCGVGVVSSATLRLAFSDRTSPPGCAVRSFHGKHQQYQLTSLQGCVGTGYCRLAAVIATENGKCFGGHVLANLIASEPVQVVLTQIHDAKFSASTLDPCELTVSRIDGAPEDIHRSYDSASGQ